MKIGKRTVGVSTIGISAAIAVLVYSAPAMAGDAYCERLENNWTGSIGQWMDWIAMCM